MIIQPERASRNVNENFYEMEMRQIAMLNGIFWDVDLTKREMRTLVCLAGWEESTVANVVPAIRKAIAAETATPSVGRKRSPLRFGRCRADVLRTSCTLGERKGSF